MYILKLWSIDAELFVLFVASPAISEEKVKFCCCCYCNHYKFCIIQYDGVTFNLKLYRFQ